MDANQVGRVGMEPKGAVSEPLVSIVMPLFNAEPYIEETLSSIEGQTYTNWELIVVDDCSTDSSPRIVAEHAERDPRIALYHAERNIGAAGTRNVCLSKVTGAFVAYMDADDVWLPEKLERQIAFMRANDVDMCFTSYETIDAAGSHRNYVHVPSRIDYRGFLKNTITCSHTIAFDLSRVSRQTLLCPEKTDFDFPEDMVVWLQALKAGADARGLDEILAKNRKHAGSRSSNKFHAIRRTWNAYRKVEGLGFLYSAHCLFWQLAHAVLKRI